MAWIRKHWRKVAGGFALALPMVKPVVHALEWALRVIGRAGDIDFIVSRLEEPGWVGVVMSWLLSPPSWLTALLIVLGLALIWWDSRRNRPTETGGESKDARLTECYRHLIQSWFRMVDEIERQYATAGHAPNHEIRRAILRRSEYHQLEPHLTEGTRINIQQPSGISIGPAVAIAGEETDTERLLRMIRSDIAAIERDWGIVPANRGRPATPAPPSP